MKRSAEHMSLIDGLVQDLKRQPSFMRRRIRSGISFKTIWLLSFPRNHYFFLFSGRKHEFFQCYNWGREMQSSEYILCHLSNNCSVFWNSSWGMHVSVKLYFNLNLAKLTLESFKSWNSIFGPPENNLMKQMVTRGVLRFDIWEWSQFFVRTQTFGRFPIQISMRTNLGQDCLVKWVLPIIKEVWLDFAENKKI